MKKIDFVKESKVNRVKKFLKSIIYVMILVFGILGCTACSKKSDKPSEPDSFSKTDVSRDVTEKDEFITYEEETEIVTETETEVADEEVDSRDDIEAESVIAPEKVENATADDAKYDSGELGVYMSKNEGWISVLFQKMFTSMTGGYTCDCSFSAKGGVLTVSCTVNELESLTDKQKQEALKAYNSKAGEMASKLKIAKAEVPSLESVVICIYDKDGDLIIGDTVNVE